MAVMLFLTAMVGMLWHILKFGNWWKREFLHIFNDEKVFDINCSIGMPNAVAYSAEYKRNYTGS